jgi:Uma2 family endonuclease
VPTRASSAVTIEPALLTAEEFLKWLKPGVHADLIYGETFMHSPVNFRHARLLNFVHLLLALYIEKKNLGEIHREVVAVRLGSRNVFLPDLCYFTKEQVARLKPAHAPFAPTLVVEALSDWSIDRDMGPKFSAYEEHGVLEYWVLDPERLQHHFYRREGEFLVKFGADAEIIHAQTIPGFFVKRSWLNPDALPPVEQALQEVLAQSS